MRFPDFIIMGAMKAGTTSLYTYLRRHPSIFMPANKEPQFFSLDAKYSLGMPWYHSLFEPAKQGNVCGEASTCYSRAATHPLAASRILQSIPNVRLLYLLRNPVDRTYSHYRHRMRERVIDGQDMLTLQQYLEAEPEAIDASLYLRQIKVYLETGFSREQIEVLLTDDLIADPLTTLNKVQAFVGVEQHDLVRGRPLHSNSADVSAVLTARQKIRSLLIDLRGTPGIKQVTDVVPLRIRVAVVAATSTLISKTLIAKKMSRDMHGRMTPLSAAHRSRLARLFRTSVVELGDWLDRDLTAWLH